MINIEDLSVLTVLAVIPQLFNVPMSDLLLITYAIINYR